VIGEVNPAVDQLAGWQAVAVALINMVGAVLMSIHREKTNRFRMEKNGHGVHIDHAQ
jgi:hypothetical protein